MVVRKKNENLGNKVEKQVAKPIKTKEVVVQEKVPEAVNQLTNQLIKDLNKEFGNKIAYNLSVDAAPTIIKRWIETGSVQLDYAIKNSAGGGYPEGRIIEIAGPPSSGKSHLAYHAAAVVQSMGGLVVYIDTENATPIEKLKQVGIDVSNRFVYCDTHCTEEVFSIIEKTVIKAKSILEKNIPILVIWDSVAATSPKAELDGEYDQNTIGLQARTISKGMRKITGVIGQNNVTLICLNQIREKIGVMFGDTTTTPGGNAIPFHASVRIRLNGGNPVKDKGGNIIGIKTSIVLKKNKVGPPFKRCEFDIIFGKGIYEAEYVFNDLREYCTKNEVVYQCNKLGLCNISISGAGAWKELLVTNQKTGEVLLEKKFYKHEFETVSSDPQYAKYVNAVVDVVYTINPEINQPEKNDLLDSREV